ncbi:ABC transporter substrate-binding protein [Helicobacter sp. 23-1048]
MYQRLFLPALIVLMSFHISLAQPSAPNNENQQSFGLDYRLDSKTKENRLVVLDPAIIEIIYMLGEQRTIKAIASLQHSHIYPEDQTKKLPSVGTFSNPSIEKIIATKPTLVILSLYSLGLREKLENLGIKTAYFEANRLDEMFDNIQNLAKMLGVESKGKQLAQKTREQIEALKSNPIGKSAIFLYSGNPLMGFNDNSMVADIMRIVGLENKTIATKIPRPIISNEFLLKANPDMLIFDLQITDKEMLIAQNPTLKNLKAYKNNQIYACNPKVHTLLRASPTIVERIKQFKQHLQQ